METRRAHFYRLSISQRKKGKLFQEKAFTVTNNCLYLEVTNIRPFIQLAVNNCGDKIVAGDQLGFLYLFDFESNQFCVSTKLNSCVTAIVFSEESSIAVDLVAATAMYNTIYFLTFNSCHESTILATFENVHKSAVNGISILESQLLTCSSFDRISLWDISTLQVSKQIKNKRVIKADFLSNSSIVVSQVSHNMSCIYIFDLHSLDLKIVLQSKCLINICKTENSLFAKDEERGEIQVFTLNSSTCESRTIPLLSENIKQAHFLTPDRIIALKDFGAVEFLPLSNSISNEERFSTIVVACNFLIVGITISGKLQVYDLRLETITNENDDKIRSMLSKTSTDKIIQKLTKELVVKYKQFPHKYRLFVWSKILKLPLNEESFKLILKAGATNAELNSTIIKHVRKEFMTIELRLESRMIKLLGCLLHWMPSLMRKLNTFSHFVLAIIKAFDERKLIQFELIATLILNNFLQIDSKSVCNKIKTEAKKLYKSYLSRGIDYSAFISDLVETGFSKVFPTSEWLILWDNIVSQGPYFIESVVVAFNCICEEVLINNEAESLKTFFSTRNFVPAKKIIEKAHQISNAELSQPTYVIKSLSKHVYPTFN